MHSHPVLAFSHNHKISELHIFPLPGFEDPWLTTDEIESLYFVLLANKILSNDFQEKKVILESVLHVHKIY